MNKKYLVYKISGGLYHMLLQINNAIYLSKITNRYLIIDCLGGAFKNDFNKFFNIPNFEYSTNYDCLFQDETIENNIFSQYINIGVKYIDKKTYFLNDILATVNVNDVLKNNDNIVYCTWITDVVNIPWCIKVNKNIVDIITDKKITNDYIGLHYRNTDIKNEIKYFISKIYEFSSKTKIIYLATDDYTALNRFKDLLNDEFNIIQYTTPFVINNGGIHYGNPNKDEIIMNTLIDIYYLTNSTYFIPSLNSGLSGKVLELRMEDNFFK